MSKNSIREKILENIKATIEDISSIKTVVRVFTPEIESYAETQFPVVAIEGYLPEPHPHFSCQQKGGLPAQFKSKLKIWLGVFAKANTYPDSVVSDLADDLWKALYIDPTRDGLAISTHVLPDMEVLFLSPYVRFSFNCEVFYIHDTNTI